MRTSTTAAIATTLFLSGTAGQYQINPDSVDSATRDFWCQQQITQCPVICLDQGSSGETQTNDCDPDALSFACVCEDGKTPNVSEYSNTLPFSICTEWGSQCVSNCGSDSGCASDCRSQHPCGAQNPTRQNTSTLTRSTTTSAGASGSGSGNARVTTDSDGSQVTIYGSLGATSKDESGGIKNVRVWALGLGQTFGTLGVIGAAVLGFAVLL